VNEVDLVHSLADSLADQLHGHNALVCSAVIASLSLRLVASAYAEDPHSATVVCDTLEHMLGLVRKYLDDGSVAGALADSDPDSIQ
jgi:hypothetical protein